jgi:pimeloyl-ACP methyl ester carboxylesterase
MIEAFRIDIAQDVLDDLQARLARTRWPADFANDDWRYGANTGFVRELADYWRSGYDWRAREAMMNGFAHFRTRIGEVPIHFIHERGRGPRPTPLILSHGWPWTFWDFHKVIGPLTDPAAHGGDPEDAFDVVVPSLPGYGFSTPLAQPGINWWKTADLWVELMDRLGYTRFGAQGGDWGSFVSAQLGHKHPERVLGVHIHTPAPLDFLGGGVGWNPDDYAPEEHHLLTEMAAFAAEEVGYMALQTTKPQTPAVALNDSPAGLLAWIVEKRRRWSDCGGDVLRRFTRDELIDTVMLYWVTESYHTSARYYWEAAHDPWRPSHEGLPVVTAPTALPIFPAELVKPSRAWAERYYNLQRRTPMAAGGHFAPMEAPEAIVADLRAFFRPLRRQAA